MEMNLKNIDYLSQKISLFYYGNKRHSGTFGGILTIMMIISCLTYIFYLFFDLYKHNSTTFQYYRYLFRNPGVYFFNNTNGIFHFFQFYNPKTNDYSSGKLNSKYIRLFMSTISNEYKKDPTILSRHEHWVYNNCRDGIDNKYFEKNKFKNLSFEDGICLRYYYNNIEKKYYPIEDSNNFIYPQLSNFDLNKFSISTIIEKCDNNSILTEALGYCAEESEINNYLELNYGLNLNVKEFEINSENYSYQKYYFIYGISNMLKPLKIIENNIIFIPVKIEIKSGIFLTKRQTNITYSLYNYYRHEEELNDNNSKILSIYNFGLSPSGYSFKNNYKTFFGCFPKIGGIIQLIYYMFYGINFFYNQFTIINDTKKLFYQLNNSERDNQGIDLMKFKNAVKTLRRIGSKNSYPNSSNLKHSNSNAFNKNIQNINNKFFDAENSKNLSLFPSSLQNISQFKSNDNIINPNQNPKKSNFQIIKEDLSSINRNRNDIIKDNEESIIGLINNLKNDNDQKLRNSDILELKKLSKKIDTINGPLSSFLDKNADKDIIIFRILMQKYFHYIKRNFVYEKTNIEDINKFSSFLKYINSSFCYKREKKFYYVLNNFRQKLLSEEHFFKTQNSIYLFEKYLDIQESQKIDIIELYKNL